MLVPVGVAAVIHFPPRRRFLAAACSLPLAQVVSRCLPAAEPAPSPGAPGYHSPSTFHWQVGLSITPTSGPCAGIFATIPLPSSWPEQEVEMVDRMASTQVSAVKFRNLASAVPQALVAIPQIAAGQTAEVTMTYKITKQAIRCPADPNCLACSTSMPAAVRKHLATSPGIEPRATMVRAQALKIDDKKRPAWERVTAICDWVRDNIECREGQRHGSVVTLREGWGQKEDLSSLFIALCRSLQIPSRTVWVPDHNYAEFYLQDPNGKGHWFPCELVGGRSFGERTSRQPILQRGDLFRVPEKKVPQRYVAEHLSVKQALARPRVQFIRQLSNPA